jgi:hypothetical protein
MDWHAWTSAVHIVSLDVIIALVLAALDRKLRASRRRRLSNQWNLCHTWRKRLNQLATANL